ncbi:MAG: asparagine synthase (glutamine-hydrolyzing) [Bryobacteraceae bacterium]
MSGFAVIYDLDGGPVDPVLCERMITAIAHRGPDGVGHHTDGPISLGFALLATTPDSLDLRQPLCDDVSGLCTVFNGRVDNRDEIKAALGASLRTGADAELALRAFERWGEDSPRRLIGDFAYVIWDPRHRTLFCARDHLGIRPFFYYTDGRTFLCASELHQLFEHPSVPKRPNEGMIAEHLSTEVTSLDETLYEGILRLPPAHFLIVSPRALRKQRYRNFDPSRQIRHKTDQEYAEHFRDTFQEAVRCCLYSQHPVAAELSGGIDSSCVVGMCQHLFRQGVVSGSGFEVFSLVFPGLPADESYWFRQVVGFWNLKSNEVPAPSDPAWFPDCAKRYLDLPDYGNGRMSDFCSTLAREKGFRVILTGLGGDDSCGHPAFQESRFRRALGRLRAQPSLEGVRSLWRDALRVLQRARTSRAPIAPWIPDAFARSTHLAERIRKKKGKHEIPFSGLRTFCMEMEDRAAARCGIEARHPFHDRRLIELTLALPPDQFLRLGQNKFILRQAMKGLLPEPVLQRSTKAEFSHTSAQLYECDALSSVFHSARIARNGWIDQHCVAEMFRESMERWKHSQNDLPHVWPLDSVLGIELWFRAAFR